MNEDSFEIDLRPHILAIVRKWWVIALLDPVCGRGFCILQNPPDEFAATASILLTRSRSSLS
jgi:hypothetical protein